MHIVLFGAEHAEVGFECALEHIRYRERARSTAGSTHFGVSFR